MSVIPNDFRDVQIVEAKREAKREPRHREVWGTIASVDGSTSPPGRPNYVYFREMDRPESMRVVYNTSTSKREGTIVRVEIDPKKPDIGRVVGIFHNIALPNEAVELSPFEIPPHRNTHQYVEESDKGDDTVLVYQPALQPLKTTGDGSTLTVTTQPLIYTVDGSRKVYEGISTDLTSYVPSTASRTVRVLLYLDKSTNILEVLEGTEVIDNGAIPVPYPTIPRNSVPSVFVQLSTSQTAITTASHIDDARDWLNGSGGYDFSFAPGEEGDILIANDGGFVVARPLFDQYGTPMLDADGVLLTV